MDSGSRITANETPRRMQAKDLTDADVMAAYERCRGRNGVPRWATTWDLQAEFPGVPPKVVLAKLRSMSRRKVLDGCGCGCRGDWKLPDAR